MSEPILRVENLSKSFGGLTVFHNISFSLSPGQVLGVIGPNGAGKTTLVNVLSNQLQASAGTFYLGGEQISGLSFPATARKGLVRSFQHTNVFPDASVDENIRRSRVFCNLPETLPAHAQELLALCGLSTVWERKASDLPYGLQKMLGLVMACLTEPSVLLLDEPAAGLERNERVLIDRMISHVGQKMNVSVMIVEHDMDLIRRVCPDCLVLEGGRILASGQTLEVLAQPAVISSYLGEPLEAMHAVD